MMTRKSAIGARLTATVGVAMLLVYAVSTPLLHQVGDGDQAAPPACCCAVETVLSESSGSCSCDCGEDVCGTAPCSSMSRTLQPMMGSAWLLDCPAAPWSTVAVEADRAESRSQRPLVPPPLTA